jgi:hypothetical protein
MRKFLIFAGTLAASATGPAFAQMASGGAPQGAADIRNSDMGAHDTATMPSNLDVIRNGIRANDMDRTAQALREKLGPARPAKAAELTAGAAVNDNTGAAIGKIEAVQVDGVVLTNGIAKVKVPADAFGHNKAGLLLDMSKAQFDKIVAQANAAH